MVKCIFLLDLFLRTIKTQNAMKNILYYGYNKKDYETAIKNFAQGSNMNYKNTYVNAGYIQDTLPLMKPPLIALFDLYSK